MWLIWLVLVWLIGNAALISGPYSSTYDSLRANSRPSYFEQNRGANVSVVDVHERQKSPKFWNFWCENAPPGDVPSFMLSISLLYLQQVLKLKSLGKLVTCQQTVNVPSWFYLHSLKDSIRRSRIPSKSISCSLLFLSTEWIKDKLIVYVY